MTSRRIPGSRIDRDRVIPGVTIHTPPATGLVGWWDAGAVNGTDGASPSPDSAVATWKNLYTGSGSVGDFMAPTSSPLWRATGGRNGYPCLEFDGASNRMVTSVMATQPTNTYSLYAVAAHLSYDTNTTDQDNIVVCHRQSSDSGTSFSRILMTRYTDGATGWDGWDGAARTAYAGSSTTGAWKVMAATCPTTSTRVAWHNTTASSPTTVGTETAVSSGVWGIGSRINPIRTANIKLQALYIYQGVNHDSTAATSIITGLVNAYGI